MADTPKYGLSCTRLSCISQNKVVESQEGDIIEQIISMQRTWGRWDKRLDAVLQTSAYLKGHLVL